MHSHSHLRKCVLEGTVCMAEGSSYPFTVDVEGRQEAG